MIHTLGFSPSLDVSYTLPSITAGTIHRPRTVLRVAGGKSLNASRALARLGRPVRAIVPLGGALGELVAELLAETGVHVDAIASDQPTRLCVSAADRTTHTLTEFYEPAPSGDDAVLTAAAERLADLPAGDWLTISGQIPPGIDGRRLAEILARSTEAGVQMAVDVHGPTLGLIIAAARPAVVKINRLEAVELAGTDHDELIDLARAVQQGRLLTVVITDGVAGSVGLDSSGQGWRVHTEAPSGGYPVGSGDCFLAGLVDRLAADSDLPTALRTAAAVAAANAAVQGGGEFDLDTVDALVALTTVTPLG